ncbi:hypothetical protein PHPALM_27761 [Phytophthora palmivora]|uniref:Uncharacterized protein n=1 Tax=Phytophthora palmivora TaxID=4796 RepID=A0A2P4XBT7_9STRA|nr:hypothetical protein PHPALM_27761 [Phytophthora palmivora]
MHDNIGENWVTTTVRGFINNALLNIEELFQDRLVMSMTKSDVTARVLHYFHLCNTLVKNNGLAVLFLEEDDVKKKYKVLRSYLPEERKTRVKNEIGFRLPTAKSNVSVLFKVVSVKAMEVDREDLALSRNKRCPRTLEAKQEMAIHPLKRARIVEETKNLVSLNHRPHSVLYSGQLRRDSS